MIHRLNQSLWLSDNACVEAARLLGWGRNTITRKLKELELK
ncbi:MULTISPECIES: helix-turn-helix domain-containing protein [Photorhabdus]|nr:MULTISPECIES: helix-turn-helix domain-containing protein [Photorhabdus]MCT8343784.1 hypothetical protein [Photorhabdus kleinii]RAW93203.1 hypothetical protein CKY03_22355 [Photorhabdus sp. S9-53]RAW93221.1 hypothetical protein CKY05_22360 [Photorhabdus sp. S10-54]RAW96662.1 hypothetical protein CKY04_22380 [Photorhabdus sp. S8-52]